MGVCCCVNYSSSRSRRREQPSWNDFKWNVPPRGKQLPSSPAGEGVPPGSTRAVACGEAALRCALRARQHPAKLSPLTSGAAQNPRLTAHRTAAQVPGPAEADEEQIYWRLLRARPGQAGARTFQFPWFSLAFLGAPGVEVGCGRPPVSSLDLQDESRCRWFRRIRAQT